MCIRDSIKELQVTVLSEMWFEAARLAGFDVMTVIALRHPKEVVGSFTATAAGSPIIHISPELAGAMWLKYTLLAERNTRGVPRVFVEYANLLEDWRREVKRISTTLGVDLNTRNEDAIDEFLTPDLRHQRQSGAAPEVFGANWVPRVYETVGAAARDESWDVAVLDEVFAAYQASERDFRRAFDDFNRNFKSVLLKPFITRMASKADALIHRRSETWA